jgi:hypothetical protein
VAGTIEGKGGRLSEAEWRRHNAELAAHLENELDEANWLQGVRIRLVLHQLTSLKRED